MKAITTGPAIRGLYAITDPALIPDDKLDSLCAAALRGGARLLQYRNKQASPAQQERQAHALLELCQAHGARLIINDSIDLAARIGAHGVHLGQSDGDMLRARDVLGPDAIIGRTCHNDLALARAATEAGANYVAFGRFFTSQTKPHALPADVHVLHTPLSITNVPVAKVAIGGVTPDNAGQLIQAGANAVAVIHALFASADPQQIELVARRFAALFPEDHP